MEGYEDLGLNDACLDFPVGATTADQINNVPEMISHMLSQEAHHWVIAGASSLTSEAPRARHLLMRGAFDLGSLHQTSKIVR